MCRKQTLVAEDSPVAHTPIVSRPTEKRNAHRDARLSLAALATVAARRVIARQRNHVRSKALHRHSRALRRTRSSRWTISSTTTSPVAVWTVHRVASASRLEYVSPFPRRSIDRTTGQRARFSSRRPSLATTRARSTSRRPCRKTRTIASAAIHHRVRRTYSVPRRRSVYH